MVLPKRSPPIPTGKCQRVRPSFQNLQKQKRRPKIPANARTLRKYAAAPRAELPPTLYTSQRITAGNAC